MSRGTPALWVADPTGGASAARRRSCVGEGSSRASYAPFCTATHGTNSVRGSPSTIRIARIFFPPSELILSWVHAQVMVVSGVAILGKENNPLYIRAFGVHDQLRFHFIVHTALDFVEEKGASTFFSHYFFCGRRG